MPRDSRFGPVCRQLIEDHGIIDLFDVDTGEAPMGQLWKPKPTPENISEKLSEFFEDLFEKYSELRENPSREYPPRP